MADSLDEGSAIVTILIDFPKAIDLVPHDQLLTKLAASTVDLRVVVWVGEFLVGRKKRVRAGGQLSKEVKVTSGVPHKERFGPTIFSSVHK